jgi:general stress protein 26
MSQVELSFEGLKKEIMEKMDKKRVMTLATSYDDYVTARDVRFTSKGLTLFFFTDDRSLKYKQIKANPIVAINSGTLRIEGISTPRSSPREIGNKDFMDTFKEKQPNSYESFNKAGFFDHPNTILVSVKPKKCILYRETANQDGHEISLDIINIDKKKASRIILTKDGYDSPAYKE